MLISLETNAIHLLRLVTDKINDDHGSSIYFLSTLADDDRLPYRDDRSPATF